MISAALLAAVGAHAQQPAPAPAPSPSPARQCADAADGSEVEVCLRIAAENPDAVYDVAAALLAHVDRAEAPDRALLEALLLLSSDRAAEGAARLGTLGDPRAVPVLLHVARSDSDPAVTEAAVAALSAYPAAIPALADWLVDREVPVRLRSAVARTLGAADAPEAADALQDALRRRMPPAVAREVVATLSTAYPERLSPGELPPSTDGARWLAAAASFGLAFSMGTAGAVSENELWPLWSLTGGVGGASVGWVAGRAWPMEAGDAATIATLGAGGAAAGTLVGAGISRDLGRPGVAPVLYGLGGQLVGFGVGYGLERIDGRTVTELDAVEAAGFAGLLGGAAEFGGVFAADNDFDSPRALLTGTSLAAGLAMGQLLAPRVDVRQQAGWVATGAGLGLAAGLLAPIGEARVRSTLPIATACGGAALGLTFGATAPPNDVFFGGTGGAVVGAGLGVGAGLLADDPELARGLGLGGMLGGYGVGAIVSRLDPDPVDDRDVAVAVAAGSWAAWDAIAAASLLDLGPRQTSGLVTLSSALATGSATALNLSFDVPVPHTLSASSIGLWGGYAGAAIGDLAGVDPFAVALPASNAGWVLGAVLMSPYVGAPPLVVGIADAGGVVGASIAATTAGLITDGRPRSRTSVVAASLAGAGVGLVTGAVVGEWWRTSTQWERRDIALRWPTIRRPTAAVGVAPLAVEGGAGATVTVSGW